MAGIDYAVHITPDTAAHIDRSAVADSRVIHRAATRGHLNEGWLESYNSFNYGTFRDPHRTNFGMLRILNDNTIAPGMGISPHYHENMEIISIPLEGALEHRDSLGNNIIVRQSHIQVMSAGRGLRYCEYNAHRDRLAKFLHIWVYPSVRNSEPRSAYVRLNEDEMRNNLALAVSPEGGGSPAWIRQNAWLYMGRLDKTYEFRYRVRARRNGVYVFLIKGEIEVNGERLRSLDGIGLWDTRCVDITAISSAKVLLMEVPMV